MRKYFESQGITIIDGAAKFVSPNEVDIEGQTVSFKKAVIATGSAPFVPPIEGLDEVGYMTSNEAINKREVPGSIIIVGGSAVGLEFATIYDSFESEVTIVEATPRIAFKEDAEISMILTKYMEDRGIKIYTGAKIDKAFQDNGMKALSISIPDVELTLRADELLIATGRYPVTDNLGLENTGVEIGKKGIEVNQYLQTSVENIYAAGDVVPFFQLAQAAAYEGDLVGHNALREDKIAVDFRVMPRVTWSYPEIASVGMTEDEAKDKGVNYITEKFPFAGLGRALTDGERLGFVKVIADVSTEEIIGCHIIGHRADEMIHEATVAMQARSKLHDLAQTIHCELTMSEGIGDVFIDLYDSLNQQKRRTA